MLFLRVVSSIIGIPIVLAAVIVGGYWYAAFLMLIVNLGLFEYNAIIKTNYNNVTVIINHFSASLLIAIIYFGHLDLIYPLLMLTFLILFATALFKMDTKSIVDSAMSLWGVIYLGGLSGYMILLRMLPDGLIYTFILLIGVWVHDTTAYFIGVKWGIRRFASQISPKKSVEGSLAGIGAVAVLFFSITMLFPGFLPVSPLQAISLALGITVFAQLGDLLESALKRQMVVKDSSSIIPGHGGILDRFDSLILVAPFVYYFFLLIDML
ncbi:MAG: phosphatidate cytidylyltransferase [Bacillota bacterium]